MSRPQAPEAAASHRRPSLAAVLVVLFVVQLMASIGLTAWLTLRQGEDAVEATTGQLRHEIGRRTHAFLVDALEVPQLINQLNAQAVALGELDVRSPEALGRHFHRQLDAFPNVSFIFFGSAHGGAAGAGRQRDPTAAGAAPRALLTVDHTPVDPELGLVTGPRYEYRVDATGERLEQVRADPGFDSRQRPWFQQAVLHGDAVWSPVYPLFFDHSLALAASRPVWDVDGTLLGVLGVDLQLTGIQRFLQDLEVGETGHIFIVERDGQLIASSTDDDLLMDPQRNDTWQRRSGTDSQNPLVRQASAALTSRLGSLEAIGGTEQLTLELLGKPHYVDVLPLRDGLGIDWLIVLAMPRSDFRGPFEVSRRRTLWLLAAGLLLAALAGGLTARSLTRPLRRLDAAARDLASGALDGRATGGGSREIDALAAAFNSMAQQLQTSFETLELRVADRTEALRQAKDAAEDADRAKSRFLANVSHELRTPLSTVLGYAELLANAPPQGAEGRLYLDAVQRQGRHLSRLLDDLIDLGRIETGSFELHSDRCGLGDLLEELRSLFSASAEEKGVELRFETLSPLPWTFRSDATRLLQILANLLSNGLRYTRRGSVSCRVQAEPTLEVATGPGPSRAQLIFSVQDTGVGIAKHDQQRLFRPFVRLTEGEATPGGFGLGLAITEQLCRLMGGHLEVESEPGRGSCFRVSIPVDACEDWGAGPPPQETPSPTAAPLSPLQGHILIVDDSPALRTLFQHMLSSWGLRCSLAADGREAVELARHEDFDAILMDWQMPGLDGLGAVQALHDAGIKTPILAITAAASAADRERCLAAGCRHYLKKPVHFPRLHAVLRQCLPAAEDSADPRAKTEPSADEARAVQDSPPPPVGFLQLLSHFVHDAQAQVPELRRQLSAQDWANLAAAGHRLAGTAGSYGLHMLTEDARCLEEAAFERLPEACGTALDELEGTLQDTIDSLP